MAYSGLEIEENEMVIRRHQNDKRTFAELNYKQQAQSINAVRMNLKKMERAHERRALEEGRMRR